MQDTNTVTQMEDNNLGGNKQDLQDLGEQLSGKTNTIARKEAILERHVKSLADRNKTWLDQLMLPAAEKEMLKSYAAKQTEAVNIILDSQNKSLSALCGGQVTFVKEVVNTLLKTGRAGLKAGADLIYVEYRNQRAIKLEILTNEFYNLIEKKIADAEKRPARLQEMKFREIEIDLKKWEEDYQLLQDEFSNILKEQV